MKRPAYGTRLWTARAEGRHPLAIYAYFGGDPAIARDRADAIYLHPDRRPGETDWRLLAGVPVWLLDQRQWQTGSGDHELLWWLAEEMARWTPALLIDSHWLTPDEPHCEWSRLVARVPELEACRWFSRERHDAYLARRAQWLARPVCGGSLRPGERREPGRQADHPVGRGPPARDRGPGGGGVARL